MAERPQAEVERAAIRQERRRLANAQSGQPGSPSRNARPSRDGANVSPVAPPRQSFDAEGTDGLRRSASGTTQLTEVDRPGDLPPPSHMNSLIVPSPRDSRAQRRMPLSPARRTSFNGRSGDLSGLTHEGSDGGSSVASGVASRRAARLPRVARKGSARGVSHDDSGSIRSVRTGRSQSGGGAVGEQAAKAGSAEVHIIGEIVGASRFQENALFCRWQLIYDPIRSWAVVRGLEQGGTQVSSSDGCGGEELAVWEHPLDIHLVTQSLQGWPSLLFMVYSRDGTSNTDLFVAYGLSSIPTTPGAHHLSVRTWFAVDTQQDRRKAHFAWFTGLHPRLEDETFITDLQKRDDAGPFISTVGAGLVHLRLQLLFKDMSQLSHVGGESLYRSLERLHTNTERAKRREDHHEAAMEEYRLGLETEGVRSVREGRHARFEAVSNRSSRDQSVSASPAPSESGYHGRSRSAEPRRSYNTQDLRDVSPSGRDAPPPRNSRSARRDSRSGGVLSSRDSSFRQSNDRDRGRQDSGRDAGLGRDRQADSFAREPSRRLSEGLSQDHSRGLLARSDDGSQEGSIAGSDRSEDIMRRATERLQRRGLSRDGPSHERVSADDRSQARAGQGGAGERGLDRAERETERERIREQMDRARGSRIGSSRRDSTPP